MLKSSLLAVAAALSLVSEPSAQIFAEQSTPAQVPIVLGAHVNTGSRFIAHGDFDGDGVVDLLAHDTLHAVVRTARGRGNGLFDAWRVVAWPNSAMPYAVAVADFTGDGALDLIYAAKTSSTPDLLLVSGDGAGGFPGSTVIPVPLGSTSAKPNAGDVDGDGDSDVLFVNGSDLVLLRNDGTATFAVERTTSGPLNGPFNSDLLADLDGDGDLDYLAGPNLFENDGTGGFTNQTATRLPLGMTTTPSVAGDFNADGYIDVVGGLTPEIYLQNASGIFTPTPLLTAATYAWDFAALDVDADGDLDLVAGGIQAAPSLLLNNGNATFVEQTLLEGSELSRLETVDVDGDGDLDVLGDHNGPGRLRLFLSVGQPRLVNATVPSLGEHVGRTVSMAAGDVDGDGDLDVIVSESCQPNLYVNHGASGLVLKAGAIPSRCFYKEMALGDLDGDGDLDLVAGVEILENVGGGLFNARVRFTSFSDLAVLHDVDGDGDLDIMTGAFWRNDGAFVFTELAAPWVTPGTRDLAIADYNGDGLDDIFVAAYGVQDRLFFGTGGGAFVEATSTSLPQASASRTVHARAADLDQDGDQDLVLGYNWTPWQGTRVYENDGTGRFSDATSAVLGSIPFGDRPFPSDFDRDGDMDLLITGDLMLFYEQTPTGFVEQTNRWTDGRFGIAELIADLDEDGDDDVVLHAGYYAPAKVLSNQYQQLHAPQLGGTGRSVVLDAYGHRGELVLPLLGSLALTSKVPTPFGRFGLDPQGVLIPLPAKAAGAAGAATSWSLNVPVAPALVGAELFAQAVFAHPLGLRLSNAVRIAIVE